MKTSTLAEQEGIDPNALHVAIRLAQQRSREQGFEPKRLIALYIGEELLSAWIIEIGKKSMTVSMEATDEEKIVSISDALYCDLFWKIIEAREYEKFEVYTAPEICLECGRHYCDHDHSWEIIIRPKKLPKEP